MIIRSENTVYKRYVDILFAFFNGCREGQGGYLMRTMRSRYNRFEDRELLDYLYKVLYNLCDNGFLDVKDKSSQSPLDGWINLTAKGADYLNGGPLTVNKVDLTNYVQLEHSDVQQFDELWSMIGEEKKAPFYIKGSTFLNMIRPYLTEYVSDYSTYIDERRNKGLSTSRRVWYKELFYNVPLERRKDFLNDLSYAVSLSFYYPENTDEDYETQFNERLASIEFEVNSEVPYLPELSISPDNNKQSSEELLDIAIKICNAFKSLIENNRMYRLLYNEDGSPKNETAAQLLFFAVALGYCKMYDVDLNRESDPGIGEMDFKLSIGNSSKVIIEMKLSSNSSLYHGFEKQLPAYLRAEETKYGIYLVLQMNTCRESQLERVMDAYDSIKDDPDNTIKLICIDATPKPSASKI